MEIPEGAGLDSIRVYFDDRGPGKGYVTITCYGCAWNSWWGAMGDRSARQFFAACDNSYLVNRMGITAHLKQRKTDHAHLSRIIDAVKAGLALTP